MAVGSFLFLKEQLKGIIIIIHCGVEVTELSTNKQHSLVNPRAVLSRARPRYRLYSRYHDIDGMSFGRFAVTLQKKKKEEQGAAAASVAPIRHLE
jgi:hypothetical protein